MEWLTANFGDFWSTYSTLVFSVGVHALLALSIWLTLSCGLLSLANAAFMGALLIALAAFASALRVAGMGPVSMMVGSAPDSAVATMRARGLKPCVLMAASLPISTAAAPSTMPDELPAW